MYRVPSTPTVIRKRSTPWFSLFFSRTAASPAPQSRAALVETTPQTSLTMMLSSQVLSSPSCCRTRRTWSSARRSLHRGSTRESGTAPAAHTGDSDSRWDHWSPHTPQDGLRQLSELRYAPAVLFAGLGCISTSHKQRSLISPPKSPGSRATSHLTVTLDLKAQTCLSVFPQQKELQIAWRPLQSYTDT